MDDLIMFVVIVVFAGSCMYMGDRQTEACRHDCVESGETFKTCQELCK